MLLFRESVSCFTFSLSPPSHVSDASVTLTVSTLWPVPRVRRVRVTVRSTVRCAAGVEASALRARVVSAASLGLLSAAHWLIIAASRDSTTTFACVR